MLTIRYLTAGLLFLLLTYFSASAQTDDHEAVRQAVLHYVNALYEVDSAQIHAGVHPEMTKRGFWRPQKSQEYEDLSPMTFRELVELSARWNARKWLPADAPKDITIFEVQDKTASAKLTALWGTDYFHLARIDGRWLIVNVLWQSPPPGG